MADSDSDSGSNYNPNTSQRTDDDNNSGYDNDAYEYADIQSDEEEEEEEEHNIDQTAKPQDALQSGALRVSRGKVAVKTRQATGKLRKEDTEAHQKAWQMYKDNEDDVKRECKSLLDIMGTEQSQKKKPQKEQFVYQLSREIVRLLMSSNFQKRQEMVETRIYPALFTAMAREWVSDEDIELYLSKTASNTQPQTLNAQEEQKKLKNKLDYARKRALHVITIANGRLIMIDTQVNQTKKVSRGDNSEARDDSESKAGRTSKGGDVGDDSEDSKADVTSKGGDEGDDSEDSKDSEACGDGSKADQLLKSFDDILPDNPQNVNILNKEAEGLVAEAYNTNPEKVLTVAGKRHRNKRLAKTGDKPKNMKVRYMILHLLQLTSISFKRW
jgi:hypothetical protein